MNNRGLQTHGLGLVSCLSALKGVNIQTVDTLLTPFRAHQKSIRYTVGCISHGYSHGTLIRVLYDAISNSTLNIFYIRAPFFSVSASLVNRLNPDPFAVEGDGHFEDVDDTGGMEGGGMLFVLDLLEGRIENVVHRLIEQSFNVISITGYFP